ncbi:MAG: DUF3604 domain-containing protein [Verrucomicrobiales bacterium]|nr:DUF3604 domain-containing protein [Verrucomicrobiales bacterium]
MRKHFTTAACLFGAFFPTLHAQTDAQMEKKDMKLPKKEFSPYVNRAYPTNVYFGDTHLHTDLSMDAGTFGNRLGLDEAYRFCRGEQVTASGGYQVKLARPLDFVVVADHSDGMGFFSMLAEGDPEFMKKEEGRRWNQAIKNGGQDAVNASLEIITSFAQGKFPWPTNNPKYMKPVWESVIAAAEKYNDPGTFTAFIGYEWTSLLRGNNLHRNVIYRGNGDTARQTLPYTLADSSDPEKLWQTMAAYEEKTGDQVLAIAHNGNLFNGMMFDVETQSGGPITKDYAERRQRWEPLYESTQIKGDGEAHGLLSPDDEFADYETWDLGNLDMSEAKTDAMLVGEYARSGLKRGLEFEEKLGVNPYKFGQVGSTDSHTSLPAVEEDNFFGKHSGVEPDAHRATHVVIGGENGKIMGYQMAASGYAAVWAKENTRASLWDAMKRKETYATTGSRMVVRFFGGWDFVEEDTQTRMPADAGYSKGVPMGGDLSAAPEGKSPTFLVAALKDAMSGNLDRIQVIKGWVDKDGKAQERIYDVAVSDGRKIDKDGRCKKAVGNTVNVEKATWKNTIGDSELIAVWKDPDFDSQQRAFYYLRVIEIPTPRWTAYEAKRFGVKMPEKVKMTTQERAYTAPIWYSPSRV